MKTMSRIDVPRSGERVAAGPAVIAGVAWSPNRGVRAVEVSIDDGPWRPCELGEAIGPETWLQWRTDWDATPGRHVLQVRAVDGEGALQPLGPAAPRPDGAEGWHRRSVEVV